MDPFVFVAVLAAAACHAGWNALLKINLEPLAATSLVAAASAAVALPVALVTGLPAAASWGYLLASVAIHIVYYYALAQAYRLGDLGQIYPIARGSAPLMTAVLASVWLGETLSAGAWASVLVLAAGILLLASRGRRAREPFDVRAVGYALATSLTITTYTLVDGVGARLSGSAAAYTVWLFVLSGGAMGLYGLRRIGRRLASDFTANWWVTMAGAALSTAAYGIAIWAMTVAPIALVAALRETSVMFAALLGVAMLREPLLPVRIAATGLVLAGVVLLRLQ